MTRYPYHYMLDNRPVVVIPGPRPDVIDVGTVIVSTGTERAGGWIRDTVRTLKAVRRKNGAEAWEELAVVNSYTSERKAARMAEDYAEEHGMLYVPRVRCKSTWDGARLALRAVR